MLPTVSLYEGITVSYDEHLQRLGVPRERLPILYCLAALGALSLLFFHYALRWPVPSFWLDAAATIVATVVLAWVASHWPGPSRGKPG